MLSLVAMRRADFLRVNPLPAGRRFAVTFVDDTDYATRANIEPVYEFLFQHGIRGTKTVWVNRQKRNSAFRRDREKLVTPNTFNGATTEDDNYRAFINILASQGYEIGLHNVAAGNSYREEIIEGLDKFKTLFGQYPRLNVFHGRNIDNLYGGRDKLDCRLLKLLEQITDRSDYQGHIVGSPYFWGDLYQDRVSYTRLPFHTIKPVNTLRWNPSMPFYDPRRPLVNAWFASSDGGNCDKFSRLLSKENLDKLEREQGACIVYTHFAVGFTRKVEGCYRLNERFVAAITDLGARKNCWFPTTSELLDRLLACKKVSVRQDGYEVTVTNHGEEAIRELVLRGPVGKGFIDENGGELPALDDCGISVGDIGPGVAKRFTSTHKRVSWAPASAALPIRRWERKRLEILNYVGLLAPSKAVVREPLSPQELGKIR